MAEERGRPGGTVGSSSATAPVDERRQPRATRLRSGDPSYARAVARPIASSSTVGLAELLDFVRPRHRLLLATTRRDGRPQISPVSGGVDADGRVLIATYPARAKTRNVQSDPRVSVLVLSDDWNGPWVQLDGDAEVLHMPEAADGLVEYFRSISGEHPDWDEYREAMRIQDKALIRVTPTRWGPIATGGFPADVAARLGG